MLKALAQIARRAEVIVAAAIVLVASTLQAGAQPSPWPKVETELLRSSYAIGVAPQSFLHLWARMPTFVGTGFQVYHGGQVYEVTAGHMVEIYRPPHRAWSLFHGYYNVPAEWGLWPQVSIAALGDATPEWHPGAFARSGTVLFPQEDVAISTDIPALSGQPLTSQTVPAVPDALPIGNWHALTPGEVLATVGNPRGTWYFGGKPTFQFVQFQRVLYNVTETNTDNPALPPVIVLPVALELWSNAAPGDSGSAVVNAKGQVVGVLVALNGHETFAVPLDSYPDPSPAAAWNEAANGQTPAF